MLSSFKLTFNLSGLIYNRNHPFEFLFRFFGKVHGDGGVDGGVSEGGVDEWAGGCVDAWMSPVLGLVGRAHPTAVQGFW